MAGAILPSDPETAGPGWSPDHLRLHRHLLRRRELLPDGASLLLAVSGGQDSMAMTGLLRDLQRHHHWRLQLWHGDHGWHPESAAQAGALAAWAERQGLPLIRERLANPLAAGNREAIGRRWRYERLTYQARQLGCSHVLTAHTASDRAETVLLHLARGSHRRGLASLRSRLPLDGLLAADPGETGATSWDRQQGGGAAARAVEATPSLQPCGTAPAPSPAKPPDPGRGAMAADRDGDRGGSPDPEADDSPGSEARGPAPSPGAKACPGLERLWLVRPLQIFCRHDTARLCEQRGWPVWSDPGNSDAHLSRNRIRAEVLPVLEALHPGAARRISSQAERLAAEQEQRQELLDLALAALGAGPDGLDRDGLLRLTPANRGALLQHWLRRHWGRELDGRSLQNLLPRLERQRGPGRLDLSGGWQLRWHGTTLGLVAPIRPPDPGHG